MSVFFVKFVTLQTIIKKKMSALNKISFALGINNDIPNQELARELAENNDKKGIPEIHSGLSDKNRRIQSNCIKVLYETGYIKPELISEYAETFIKLLSSKNNRLVWGSMIALMTIADINPKPLLKQIDNIKKIVESGSVITKDAGFAAIAKALSTDKKALKSNIDFLFDWISKIEAKRIPKFVEDISPVMIDPYAVSFLEIIESRKKELSNPQLSRLNKTLKKITL